MTTAKEVKNSVDELNVDFENFTLPKERSDELRSTVQKVKETDLVETLRTLVSELGVEEESVQNDQMASLIKAKNPKVFRQVIGENSEQPEILHLFLVEQEMRLSINGRSVLEVSFLPKDKDFLLFYVEPNFLAGWSDFAQRIAGNLAEAGKIKSDRQKHFKKFKKETPHEEPTEDNFEN